MSKENIPQAIFDGEFPASSLKRVSDSNVGVQTTQDVNHISPPRKKRSGSR